MGKYYYKEPYFSKDENVKFKRCKTCNKLHKNVYMEVGFTCRTCYVNLWDKKRCRECFLLKPVSEFRKRASNKDKFQHKWSKKMKI